MKFLIRKKDQSRAKASLNAAERRQFGSEFSPLFDAFHPIFPLSTEQYISRPLTFYEKPSHAFDPLNDPYVDHRPKTSGHHHCTDPKADACHDGKNTKNCGHLGCLSPEVDDHYGRDLVLGLPTEVSDLIFSYLTPAALDAARHTCWRWRKYILRNNWVLSSVLDGSYAINTRDLLKKLDCDSDLLATSGHPDAWRTRFRIRNLDFSLYSPAICKAGTSRPRFVAAARCGTQNGFLVFQLSRSYGEHESSNLLKSTLVLYRFDSTDLPLYVGTIGHPADGGKLRIISAADNRQGASWILKVEIGEIASLYSITIRKAFSRSDSRFLLRNFPPHEEPMQEIYWSDTVKELERPSDGVPQSCNSWRILAQLPLHAAVSMLPCFKKAYAAANLITILGSTCLFLPRLCVHTKAPLPGRTGQNRQNFRDCGGECEFTVVGKL